MTDSNRPTRLDLLARLDLEEVEWKALLAEFGEDRMEIPGVTGDWTFKDVAAHLNGWRQPHIAAFQALLSGQPVPKPNWPVQVGPGSEESDDEAQAINDWLYQENHDRPLAGILAESQQQWEVFHTVVEDLPDDLLYGPNVYDRLGGKSIADRIINGDFFSHFHEEHEPALHAWLAGEQPESEEIK